MAVAGLAVVTWVIVHGAGFPRHRNISDVPLYEGVARRIAAGEVPYRDFDFEYPPLAAGVMALARIVPVPYATGFSLLMAAALCATALGVLATARALGMSPVRQAAAGGVAALTPLLLGDIVATRFDMAVAAAIAWTVWAAVTGRWTLAWALLAAAVALKLAPVVLVPVLVIWHLRSARGRAVAARAALAGAAVAVAFLPFVAAAPENVGAMFRYHIDRPLQIESLGGAYLLGLHALADIPLTIETSFGSQNLVGGGPDVIAAGSAGLLAVALAAVAATFAVLLRRIPRPGGAHLFVTAAAATVAVTVGLGKVMSPQFMMWLVPATLLVAGPMGRRAFAVTVAVLVATQLYFPDRYWDLVALDTTSIVLLVARDALIVALIAVAWPRPGQAPPPALGGADVTRPAR